VAALFVKLGGGAVDMIAEGDGPAAPNATTHDILRELKSCSELGQRLNACVARQRRDRCGGRFFGPELIPAVITLQALTELLPSFTYTFLYSFIAAGFYVGHK
jgi:hypothetical protein